MTLDKVFSTSGDIKWLTNILDVGTLKRNDIDLHVQQHLTSKIYRRIYLKAIQLCELNPATKYFHASKVARVHVETGPLYDRKAVVKPMKMRFQRIYDEILPPHFRKKDHKILSQPLRGKSFHLRFLNVLYTRAMDDVARQAFLEFIADLLQFPRLEAFHRLGKRKRENEVGSLKKPSLLHLLLNIEDNNASLAVLRAKKHAQSKLSSKDLTLIIALLKYNETVQALYLHGLGRAFTDEIMDELITMLKENTRIWAVHVGDNEYVSQKMWGKLATELPYTNVSHLLAGSEASICAELKAKMHGCVRKNRKKHRLHCDPSNASVIRKVKGMWQNPRVQRLAKTA